MANEEKNNITETPESESVSQSQSGKKVVVILGIALAIAAVVLTVAFGAVIIKSMNGNNVANETLAYQLTTGNGENSLPTEQEETFFDLRGESQATDLSGYDSQQGVQSGGLTSVQGSSDKTTKAPHTKSEAVKYYEQLSPNGENVLSDNVENKFIKQISNTYNIDSDFLVAIYSEPDTGNNFVLEFNGKRDSSGNVVKSPDTLFKVYQIDKSGNVKIATGKDSGNVGVSYAEGLFCMSMIKTVVMNQYPDYFTGVD